LRPLERDIQAAVMQHWKTLGYPSTLVAAIPNANAHGQPGLTAGLADLIICGPKVPGKVAFMELKRDPTSRRTDAQMRFARLSAELGICYSVVYGRDQPIEVLERWGVVKRAAQCATSEQAGNKSTSARIDPESGNMSSSG
jgi:hypothetical protein